MSVADIQTAGASIPYSEMGTSITVCALPIATSLIVVKHVIVYKEGEGDIEREFADEINLTVTIMSDATLSMTLN